LASVSYIAFGSLVSGGLVLALLIAGEWLGAIGIAGAAVGVLEIVVCSLRGQPLWSRLASSKNESQVDGAFYIGDSSH
jgi:hypothetical protein